MSKEDSPLFTDRTPTAAALQLATVLAWATECNLATLEQLQARKRASRSDKERQQRICELLVYHCRDLKVRPNGFAGERCKRLAEELK